MATNPAQTAAVDQAWANAHKNISEQTSDLGPHMDPNTGLTTSATSVQGGIMGLGQTDYHKYIADQRAWNSDFANQYVQQAHAADDELANRQPRQMHGATPVQAALAQSTDAAGATINQGPQGENRQRQMSLADSLTASANGTGGPTAADLEFKQASDANMRGAMSMAASAPAHGGSYSAAMKQAMMANAGATQSAALQAGQLRANEQIAARSQLGSVLDQSRGADIGLATSQAGLTQQNSQFNAGQSTDISRTNAAATNTAHAFNASMAQDTQRTNLAAGMNQDQWTDQMRQKYLAMGYSMEQAQQQAAIDFQRFQVNSQASQEAALHDRQAANAGQAGQAIAAGVGAAGALAASLA